MKTLPIYGLLPLDLGRIEMPTEEMMFWLYLPVKIAGECRCIVPDNLRGHIPILGIVRNDLGNVWRESYIYLTVKTLHVNVGETVNRPGWHSDGFLTDDINYIWYDSAPTRFFVDGKLHSFSCDHEAALVEMKELCEGAPTAHYPCQHVLKMDQRVLHKASVSDFSGVRTFIKVSVSEHKYLLKGNSINHRFKEHFDLSLDRKRERNCPTGGVQ
jgi:hypothetical protein